MKKLILILIAILLLGNVSALTEEEVLFIESYEGQKIPGNLKIMFGNERINLNLDEQIIGILVEDGVIKTIGSSLNKPTIEIFVSDENLSQIIEANNKKAEIKQLLKDKEIRIKTSFIKGIKIKTALVMFKIFI